jgi:hypothetical protein
MNATQLYLGLAIITAATAQADSGNPLHPSYYWSKASAIQTEASGAKAYVDSRNPLHPTYAHVVTDWQPAVSANGSAYNQSNHPLHPSFKR